MMKQYTKDELDAVKNFAFLQWENDLDIVSFYHAESHTDITCPWVDWNWKSGWRGEFNTVEDVIKCYGESMFCLFCDRVLTCMRSSNFGRFGSVTFSGTAIATMGGRVIWTNIESGDCPPDIYLLIVKEVYAIDGIIIFDLKQKGE